MVFLLSSNCVELFCIDTVLRLEEFFQPLELIEIIVAFAEAQVDQKVLECAVATDTDGLTAHSRHRNVRTEQ